MLVVEVGAGSIDLVTQAVLSLGLPSPEGGKPRHQVQLRNYFPPKLFLSFCIPSTRIRGCLKGVVVGSQLKSLPCFPISAPGVESECGTLRLPQILAFFTFPISCTSNLEIQSGFQYRSILYTYKNGCYFQSSTHCPATAVCDTPQRFGVFSSIYACRNVNRCVQKGQVCII